MLFAFHIFENFSFCILATQAAFLVDQFGFHDLSLPNMRYRNNRPLGPFFMYLVNMSILTYNTYYLIYGKLTA